LPRTIVVGAGVIGLACAYALRKRGRDVVVLDSGTPGGACSLGNAGWICPSISSPVPAPGLTRTSLKWMLRSDSPLYIAPRAVPSMARWLFRFWRHCNRRDFEAGLRATAELNRHTFSLFDALEADGVRCELYRRGLLYVFTDEPYMMSHLGEFKSLAAVGYDMPSALDGPGVRALEPELSDAVVGGFLVSHEYHVRPETLTAAYEQRLKDMGVELRIGTEVMLPLGDQTGWRGVDTSTGPVEGDEIVLAAGAWTGKVAQRFGVSLPVQAGKGYSVTIPTSRPTFTRPLYLGDARIGASPFEGAIRFAGTMELSGINQYLDPRRVAGVRKGIGRYMRRPPGGSEGTEWVGMRPMTPDGLPMLGRAPGQKNLFIATGHAMLGITLAPATGEAIAQLVTDPKAGDLYRPFDPARFHGLAGWRVGG
jgi:D-amino-acid dehydrogenase